MAPPIGLWDPNSYLFAKGTNVAEATLCCYLNVFGDNIKNSESDRWIFLRCWPCNQFQIMQMGPKMSTLWIILYSLLLHNIMHEAYWIIEKLPLCESFTLMIDGTFDSQNYVNYKRTNNKSCSGLQETKPYILQLTASQHSSPNLNASSPYHSSLHPLNIL